MGSAQSSPPVAIDIVVGGLRHQGAARSARVLGVGGGGDEVRVWVGARASASRSPPPRPSSSSDLTRRISRHDAQRAAEGTALAEHLREDARRLGRLGRIPIVASNRRPCGRACATAFAREGDAQRLSL